MPAFERETFGSKRMVGWILSFSPSNLQLGSRNFKKVWGSTSGSLGLGLLIGKELVGMCVWGLIYDLLLPFGNQVGTWYY